MTTRVYSPGPFQDLHFFLRLRTPPFLVAENAVYVWLKGPNGEKKGRFEKDPHTCSQGLSHRYAVCGAGSRAGNQSAHHLLRTYHHLWAVRPVSYLSAAVLLMHWHCGFVPRTEYTMSRVS